MEAKNQWRDTQRIGASILVEGGGHDDRFVADDSRLQSAGCSRTNDRELDLN